MKKLLAVILSIILLLPAFALADLPDLAAMSDQELKDLIAACSQELITRNTVEPEGTLLFDESGVRLYQIGEAYIERGRLKIPCMIYNDMEISGSVSPVSVVCNGYAVYGYTGGELPPQSRKKCELDFATADLELNSVDEIYSLILGWEIYSLEKPGVVYGPSEREEYRFW